MSFEAKLIFTACVLAIVVPMAVMVTRRMIRGEPFKKSATTPLMPPSPPPIDVGGPPSAS